MREHTKLNNLIGQMAVAKAFPGFNLRRSIFVFAFFVVCFRFVLLRDIMSTTGLPVNVECLKSSDPLQ